MVFHLYEGRWVIYETLEDARVHAQAAIDEFRKQATQYEWPDMVSEIAVYEAPDDCGEPWRDGTLVLEARERVVEDEDHPLGRFSEFDLVEVRSTMVSFMSWAAENISVETRGFHFTLIDLACEEADLSGLPESADILLRLPGTDAFCFYGRGRLNVSGNSVSIVMSEPFPNEHRPLIRNGVLDVLIRSNFPDGPNRVIILESAMFRTSPTKGTVSIERSVQPDDDDSNEEPGEMCRLALARAETSVDLINQVRLLVVGAEDEADFEATYGTDPDEIAVYTNAAREIINLVRATPAPDTITLSRDQLTSALREAAAQGMDRTSGPSCEEAASCRDVADEIVEAIEVRRFSPDRYVYALVDEQRAIQRARQGASS